MEGRYGISAELGSYRRGELPRLVDCGVLLGVQMEHDHAKPLAHAEFDGLAIGEAREAAASFDDAFQRVVMLPTALPDRLAGVGEGDPPDAEDALVTHADVVADVGEAAASVFGHSRAVLFGGDGAAAAHVGPVFADAHEGILGGGFVDGRWRPADPLRG